MPVFEGGGGPPSEEEGLPNKATRRPPPPPPGPGGGPIGGFGGGFGGATRFGLGSALFNGLPGLEENLPILLRKRGMQRPNKAPSPAGRDTVPAMLQPGEKVIPENVSQNPQVEPMLDELIAQGRQGMGVPPGQAYGQGPINFAGGGEVPDIGAGGRPSRAIRLLQLLLELDEQDGGGVPGFAFGGTAGFGSFRDRALGGLSGSPFANRMGPRLGAARPGAAPPGPGGSREAPPTEPGGFQYNRDVEGMATNYNPNDPWGSYGASQNPYGLGALYRNVGAAGAAGAFDPRGNQALINSQLEAAQGTKDALVRRAVSGADLAGLDPAQRAVAKLRAQQEAGRGVQDISAQIRANEAARAQEFNQQMLRDLYGGGLQYNLNEQNARNERIAQQNAGRVAKQNQWNPGALFGQLGGAAIGGWASGGFGRGGRGASAPTMMPSPYEGGYSG